MVSGPVPPPSGIDNVVDQVVRLRQFRDRHPKVMITSPRQNGTWSWHATWIEPGGHPDDEGSVTEVKNTELRFLLNRLEARFDEEEQ